MGSKHPGDLERMHEDISTEQNTWQLYNFGKRNVFRLDLNRPKQFILSSLDTKSQMEMSLSGSFVTSKAKHSWFMYYFIYILLYINTNSNTITVITNDTLWMH